MMKNTLERIAGGAGGLAGLPVGLVRGMAGACILPLRHRERVREAALESRRREWLRRGFRLHEVRPQEAAPLKSRISDSFQQGYNDISQTLEQVIPGLFIAGLALEQTAQIVEGTPQFIDFPVWPVSVVVGAGLLTSSVAAGVAGARQRKAHHAYHHTGIFPGETVIDYNACKGDSTRHASEIVGNSGRILSVALDPEHKDCLDFRIRSEYLHNVSSAYINDEGHAQSFQQLCEVQYGLGNVDGILVMHGLPLSDSYSAVADSFFQVLRSDGTVAVRDHCSSTRYLGSDHMIFALQSMPDKFRYVGEVQPNLHLFCKASEAAAENNDVPDQNLISLYDYVGHSRRVKPEGPNHPEPA
ncbi:hypothetical protein JW868_00725 [Candidatus Woesearchaeota archaeon]|nr:hypothetical protein [Candidatus Woesearchaeota archaeon]